MLLPHDLVGSLDIGESPEKKGSNKHPILIRFFISITNMISFFKENSDEEEDELSLITANVARVTPEIDDIDLELEPIFCINVPPVAFSGIVR